MFGRIRNYMLGRIMNNLLQLPLLVNGKRYGQALNIKCDYVGFVLYRKAIWVTCVIHKCLIIR